MDEDNRNAAFDAAAGQGCAVGSGEGRGRPPTMRGISFSAPMVLALLAGTKTQTRRVVKEKHIAAALHDGPASRCCPFRAGDRLWVREAYRLPAEVDALSPGEAGAQLLSRSASASPPIRFDADGATRDWPAAIPQVLPGKRRMGMFMPRWGARILLDVVEVRAERLAACTAGDAVAEGIERLADLDGVAQWRLYGSTGHAGTPDPLASYRSLWEQINGAGSWAADPLVWVVVFRQAQRDSLPGVAISPGTTPGPT